jgi:hypothetical protein
MRPRVALVVSQAGATGVQGQHPPLRELEWPAARLPPRHAPPMTMSAQAVIMVGGRWSVVGKLSTSVARSTPRYRRFSDRMRGR